VTDLTVQDVDDLMLKIQPGHLMRECNALLLPDKRDEFRALLLNLRLAKASVKGS
jgi:protein-arginine kinase